MTQEVTELFGITRLSESGISHICDNVVLLQYLREESELKRSITVLKTRASTHQPHLCQFDITPTDWSLENNSHQAKARRDGAKLASSPATPASTIPTGNAHHQHRQKNIADLSGLALALRAYRLSLGGQRAAVMGGFTGEQRLFLGWAQMWRGKIRDQALRAQLLSDPHSPKEFRANGVVSNLPEYYTQARRQAVPAARPNASKSGN